MSKGLLGLLIVLIKMNLPHYNPKMYNKKRISTIVVCFYCGSPSRCTRTLIFTRSCCEEVAVNSDTVKANKYVDIFGVG